MGLQLVTAPTTEPITLTEAKLHLRESDTAQDTIIQSLISAARRHIEERCRRSLITQTWLRTLDQFPTATSGSALWAPFEIGIPRIPPGDATAGDLKRKWSGIRLVRGPVISITSLQFYDSTGALQTIPPNQYELDTTAPVAIVCPTIANPWPTVRSQLNAVLVTYLSGYGPTPADVPSDITAALKLLLGAWYENREAIATSVGTMAPVPMAVDALLAPYELPEAA